MSCDNLTDNQGNTCISCQRSFSTKRGLSQHRRSCKSNENANVNDDSNTTLSNDIDQETLENCNFKWGNIEGRTISKNIQSTSVISNTRYLELSLCRTFSSVPWSFRTTFDQNTVRYLEPRYLELSLCRTNFMVPSAYFVLLSRTFSVSFEYFLKKSSLV